MTQPTHPDSRPDPARLLALAQGNRREGPPQGCSPPSPAELAALLPDFEVHELIGRGGMGAVYRARQKRLDRVVAIKVLPPEVARDPAFAERFRREARTLARLSHPNIVRIFDVGEVQGLGYLVLEYVEGTNLRQLMAMGRLSPAEALRLVPKICDALQYAHDQGVVHRDIKPENLLLDHQGEVHIADFGIARLLGEDVQGLGLTATRQRVGTPHYMAPEQIESPERVDHRADIFALGVVLYEMLTGSLPLGRFAPPSEGSAVGPRVDDIVLRSLDREPARRYQAAAAMKDDVEAAWREGFLAGQRGARGARGGAAAEPPQTTLGDAVPADAEPPAPRLSWMAVAGLLWLLASPIGLFLVLAASPAGPVAAPAEPEDQTLPRLISIAVLLLSVSGGIGGPILGAHALKRIRQSNGRLYGVRPAVLAMWAPVLLVLDAAVVGVFRAMATDAPSWVGAMLALVVLYLNYRFLARQAEQARVA